MVVAYELPFLGDFNFKPFIFNH